jgi:ABC-type glycerol-3-phosphate transport system substrate-binding protein
MRAHRASRWKWCSCPTADHHQQLATAIAAGSGASDVVMLEQAWVGRFKDGEGFENSSPSRTTRRP